MSTRIVIYNITLVPAVNARGLVIADAATIEAANMSLGGSGSEGSCNDGGLHEVICSSVAAGVIYVAAAGNSSADSANHVPASYDEVITVPALADFDSEPGELGSPTCRSDVEGTLADFSNYGADCGRPPGCFHS